MKRGSEEDVEGEHVCGSAGGTCSWEGGLGVEFIIHGLCT